MKTIGRTLTAAALFLVAALAQPELEASAGGPELYSAPASGALAQLDGCEIVTLTVSGTDTIPSWASWIYLDVVGGGGGGGGGGSSIASSWRPGGSGGAGAGRWTGWVAVADLSDLTPPYIIGSGGAHGEDWVVVFNPAVLRSVTKVPAREVGKQAPFNLPRVKR